jgi:small subunit ribosomal protein S9
MKTQKTSKTTQKTSVVKSKPLAHSVGRRKTSVARIWLKKGSGNLVVNGQAYEKYFDTDVSRLEATKPFQIVPVTQSYDIDAYVNGGGKTGQAGAVKLGIARALLELDEGIRRTLREHGLLTVDSRQKERKKYGQRGARRKFQFVKR